MLTHLTIENYALIDHLDIDLYQGFTAITGETGAGKSILVDALELVLGNRADSQILLDPLRKCFVEAHFSIDRYNLKSFFEKTGLDYEDQVIMRREILPAGKSRSFINDTPVNLNLMKNLGELLVDIHAQHATSSLHDPLFQLSVIDSYAELDHHVADFQNQYVSLQESRIELKKLVQQEENLHTSLDYKRFLLEEIKSADFKPSEQEQLEDKLNLMTHSEEIKTGLFQVSGLMHEDEQSALNLLLQSETVLHKIANYHPDLSQLQNRLKSDLIDLKDIVSELTRLNESIEFSPEEMETVRQRLDLLYRLQHKHHISTVTELIETGVRLIAELNDYTSLGEQIENLKQDIKRMENELEVASMHLTSVRKSVFHPLEKEMIKSLNHMGIPEARFEIRHELSGEYHFHGRDQITFYFNANEGHSLKPLSDIASGGELSRVMLSLKSILSNKKLLPTILFDEIDNGLSGDVAGRVGDVLVSVASGMQVIAVTHLPQIAGRAKHHYSVFKQNKNNITLSSIKFLDHEERISELAKMIGGRDITEASRAAATELLIDKT